LKITSSMDALIKILPDDIFLRIHRSFLINKDHVNTLTLSRFIMSNGDELFISRTYVNKVRAIFTQWLR
jgi:DNA-binding LytR/AlgR family response regulator